MLKRKNKKGFTLAELLIVVAIIAVLVAIAVPLFVGALDEARDRVVEGNCRSLRSIGAAEILLNQDKYLSKEDETYGWVVTGKVDEDGNVTVSSIEKATSSTTWTTAENFDETSRTLTVQVKRSDLTALETP